MLKGVMSDPIDEDSQLGRENQAGKGYPPADPEQLCLLFCSKLSWRIRNDMKQLMCRAKLVKEEEKRQE
ncbi:hypothetical protein Q9966_001713 [Columba livia]|nr:hypothetical protein Q9966_001713 [Columba livia]